MTRRCVNGWLGGGRRWRPRSCRPWPGSGAPDPQLATDALAACFEGLFLHDIGRHAQVDARPVLALVVRAAVGD